MKVTEGEEVIKPIILKTISSGSWQTFDTFIDERQAAENISESWLLSIGTSRTKTFPWFLDMLKNKQWVNFGTQTNH